MGCEEGCKEEYPRGPGRPRDPAIDQAVLAVALKHMASIGYTRMTLDGVAAEAGVTKPAIYRRWSGKEDLATAALAQLRVEFAPTPTGDAKADLIAVLEAFSTSLANSDGFTLAGSMLAEEKHRPEFMRLFRERVVLPRRRMLRDVLERARGEEKIRSDSDLDAVMNMLIGAFHARHLEGFAIEENWPRRLVETVWAGIRV